MVRYQVRASHGSPVDSRAASVSAPTVRGGADGRLAHDNKYTARLLEPRMSLFTCQVECGILQLQKAPPIDGQPDM